MEQIKVYRHWGYDIVSNQKVYHGHATLEYIQSTRQTFPIEDSVMTVSPEHLDAEGRYVAPE